MACCRDFSVIFQSPVSVVEVFSDGRLEIGVEFGVLSELANRLDGGSPTSMLASKDNGGVLSVRTLNLDVIGVILLDCCRSFDTDITVGQHFKRCCPGVVKPDNGKNLGPFEGRGLVALFFRSFA
jgi:hypothetical protein